MPENIPRNADEPDWARAIMDRLNEMPTRDEMQQLVQGFYDQFRNHGHPVTIYTGAPGIP